MRRNAAAGGAKLLVVLARLDVLSAVSAAGFFASAALADGKRSGEFEPFGSAFDADERCDFFVLGHCTIFLCLRPCNDLRLP
jgi:hypothetical protein